jgi:polysaccharide biosynthesis transport protein
MTTTAPPSLTPGELAKLLATRRLTWMVPVLVCGVLAAGYSLVMPRYWEASQALVVRQETAGARGATPGKFSDLYEMRTLQETILELAKSQQVVASTLKAVNLRALGVASEPTAEDIERFRKRLKMLPPNGGEFGKSEVFYFCVKDKSQARALELVAELCNQLDVALKQLRTVRAKNLIVELEQQVAQATATLNNDTRRLAEFEAAVGADLGELRMLHSAASGQSDLRQEAVQLEAEHRRFRTQVRETEQLLAMLRAAQQDPQQIVATPNSLLAAQPALRRLKDGLVDAQLATAKMAGTRSADHPRVKAAAEAESQIRADLHRELVSAIRGAEAELRLSQQRVAATESRQKNLAGRLGRLAER